jgi:hypothetical protein
VVGFRAGEDHGACVGGVAAYVPADGDDRGATALTFRYVVRDGDATPALDVLNATALRGRVFSHATPAPVLAADLALPPPGGDRGRKRKRGTSPTFPRT